MSGPVVWQADLGGGVAVTLLRVETHRVDPGPLFGPVPRLLWERVAGERLDAGQELTIPFHALLVETPAGRALVDAGLGDGSGAEDPRSGGPGIVGALAGAGIAPDAIDLIVATNLHRQHIGGAIAADGTPVFPRARVVAQAAEWAIADRRNARIARSYDRQGLEVLAAASRPGAVDGDDEVVPGVRVVRTGGFSAGHQVVLVEGSGGPAVAFPGDLLMLAAQANPRWITAWDDFPLDSVTVKGSLFARAAAEDWIVIACHEPGDPVGRLVPDRDRFRMERLG